jgi:DmsE family decaheme c-type cytochrome
MINGRLLIIELFLATAFQSLCGQVSGRPGGVSSVTTSEKYLSGFAGSAVPAASAAGSKPQEFAGNEKCKTCHPGEWKQFYKNPHFKSLASGKETPERTGCEGCHGPAKAHILAGGGKTTIPRAFTLMNPQQIIRTCLTCHAKDFNRASIRRSEHTQHNVACTECHSSHHPVTDKNLLVKNQPELCYQCHADVRAMFNMPSKHRVNEGLMKCTDCHNAHGGFTPSFGMGQTSKMLHMGSSGEQPCLNCHVDKKGPFQFEHEVSQTDGCIACHKPHGSTTGALLIRNTVGQLCLECHTGTGNFAANNRKGITVPDSATHSMIDPAYQRCTGCHVRIHGSNAHYRFLR